MKREKKRSGNIKNYFNYMFKTIYPDSEIGFRMFTNLRRENVLF